MDQTYPDCPVTQQDFIAAQGRSIATALQRQGYQTERIDTGVGWKITQPDHDWLLVLTFLPRPVSQWRLLPASHNPVQSAIYTVIEEAIGGRR